MTIAADIAACLSILIMVAGGIILSVLLDKMYWIVDNRLLSCLGVVAGLPLSLVGFAQLSSATAPGAEDVEVVETREIAALVVVEDDEYIVVEDTRSDGGLSKKSYPTDGTLVYEDAAPEEARVEVVEIKKLAGGTFFGIPVTGVVDTDEGYRIHVPEGSFEMEGLYSLSVQGV